MAPRRTMIGSYELQERLGQGGMGVVHLAYQPSMARAVALKEMQFGAHGNVEAAARFLQEARIAGSLSHPNIITVYDYFDFEGAAYIAMEYAERGPVAFGALTLSQRFGVLEALLAGLAFAGEREIVHRDLKPANLLVTADGRLKIADFGIAKALDVTTELRLTATNQALGTPTYMAPEQALGQAVTPRSDLYSTGVLAFELFTGRPPFDPELGWAAVMFRHVHEAPPRADAAAPQVGPELADWLERMLAKDPADRPADATEAWTALEEIAVSTLGWRWRRTARLTPEAVTGQAAPLTPAAFARDDPSGTFETFEDAPPAVEIDTSELHRDLVERGLREPTPAPRSPTPPRQTALPPADVPSTVAPTPRPRTHAQPARQTSSRRGPKRLVVAALALLTLGGGGLAAALLAGPGGSAPEAASRPTSSATSAPTASSTPTASSSASAFVGKNSWTGDILRQFSPEGRSLGDFIRAHAGKRVQLNVRFATSRANMGTGLERASSSAPASYTVWERCAEPADEQLDAGTGSPDLAHCFGTQYAPSTGFSVDGPLAELHGRFDVGEPFKDQQYHTMETFALTVAGTSGTPDLEKAAQLQVAGFEAGEADDYDKDLTLSSWALQACAGSKKMNPCGYAIYEKGIALYRLGRYDAAATVLQQRLDEYGDNDKGEVAKALAAAEKKVGGG